MGATGGFVGRDAELAALNERLRSALDGTGQVVLIAGEPGVGKTRLAGEIAIQARELGLAHGSGRATEDKGSPPYWPFLQAFRTLGRPAPPELDARDGSPNTTDGSSAHQRFRLFETVTDSLVAEAESGGLLLTLDDVQWADPASLLLLVHLAMALPAAPARMLVLVTYRDTETTGQEHLRTAIGSLARESAVTRLRLTGLSESEVAAHLAGVTGWAVPTTVAAAVCRRTQGNPFFVGELGRVLASSMDGHLPEGVRAAVHDRLARLSTACREMISAAAVLGSTVDPAAVADATGASLVDVLTALDEATKAGIVTEARHFAHDLIREAARHELPTAQRLTVHHRLAAYLGKRADADGRVAEVAYHHLESLPAGDPEAAVVWAERAADRAAVQYAWEEAANLYQRALQAATAHNLADPARQCRMWLAIAAAQVRSFGVAEARESLLEAVRLARGLGDHESDRPGRADHGGRLRSPLERGPSRGLSQRRWARLFP